MLLLTRDVGLLLLGLLGLGVRLLGMPMLYMCLLLHRLRRAPPAYQQEAGWRRQLARRPAAAHTHSRVCCAWGCAGYTRTAATHSFLALADEWVAAHPLRTSLAARPEAAMATPRQSRLLRLRRRRLTRWQRRWRCLLLLRLLLAPALLVPRRRPLPQVGHLLAQRLAEQKRLGGVRRHLRLACHRRGARLRLCCLRLLLPLRCMLRLLRRRLRERRPQWVLRRGHALLLCASCCICHQLLLLPHHAGRAAKAHQRGEPRGGWLVDHHPRGGLRRRRQRRLGAAACGNSGTEGDARVGRGGLSLVTAA